MAPRRIAHRCGRVSRFFGRGVGVCVTAPSPTSAGVGSLRDRARAVVPAYKIPHCPNGHVGEYFLYGRGVGVCGRGRHAPRSGVSPLNIDTRQRTIRGDGVMPREAGYVARRYNDGRGVWVCVTAPSPASAGAGSLRDRAPDIVSPNKSPTARTGTWGFVCTGAVLGSTGEVYLAPKVICRCRAIIDSMASDHSKPSVQCSTLTPRTRRRPDACSRRSYTTP